MLVLVPAVFMAGCASQADLPLARVDLPRMYGSWYIVATIPNWFEKGMVAPRDSFSPRPDGDIREDFHLRRGSFGAPEKHFIVHDWVRAHSNNAHWRVRVFWPIDLPFLVLDVDPDYQWVLFGEQDRSLGWIYSRQPAITESQYQALLVRFSALGYDASRFRKVIQFPDQVGIPGFWSDEIQR
jgi:apolipoprotein D and lipocalin family protein